MTPETSSVDLSQVKTKLKSQDIFNSLTDNELNDLCSEGSYTNFKVGEALIKEEAPNHYLYLLLEGKVHIKSYGIKIRSVSEGNLVGEISAAGLGSVTDDSATAEVVAATVVKTIRFPVSLVHELAKTKQEFADTLHNAAMSRLLS